MTTASAHAWFTVSEINAWADEYHLTAVKRALKSVQLSGEPAEIGAVYIGHLAGGFAQFEGLVKDFDLSCKLDKTTGRYIVEKPGRAFK
jgi:hypothetical protein